MDNVTKACLDALTGALWKDDRQVQRLTVERLAGGDPGIVLAVRPATADDGDGGRTALAHLLARVDGL